MTIKDINDIINAVCPNDEDYEKPCISPKYLRQELEQLALDQEQKYFELEPTTENCESCEYYGSHHEVCNYCYKCSLWTEQEPTTKNNLGVDCISRDDVRDVMQELWGTSGELMDRLMSLPSVTPQLSSGLEKNSKKLEKDFGESDCISRAQAQTEIEMNASRYTIAKERGGMGQVEWSDQLIKVSDAVDIIRNLPSVTPQEPKWISVKDRLPQRGEYGDVLVTFIPTAGTLWATVMIARYSDLMGIAKPCFHIGEVGKKSFENITPYVIAWMPLPKPYEPQESEEKE